MKKFSQLIAEAATKTPKEIKAPYLGSRSDFSKSTKKYEIHHEVGDDDTHNLYHGHFHGHPFRAEVSHGDYMGHDMGSHDHHKAVTFFPHSSDPDDDDHYEPIHKPHGMSDEHATALSKGLHRHAQDAHARWQREEEAEGGYHY